MDLTRLQKLRTDLDKKSVFLFGPRQTGKSTLIRHEFKDAIIIQLLNVNTQRLLIDSPMTLATMIPENTKIVVIDEIQKIPELLDVVHLLIEERKINFLLTGSSARKIRRSGVNLLGGRARVRNLFPLSYKELNEKFDLLKALTIGTLPSIYFSDEPSLDLKSYVSEYLIQEIAHEGISRNIPAFSRFLEVAALNNGQILNYTSIGSDAGVKRGTVQNYYEILEDTLIGFRLPVWNKSKQRKSIESDKFYLFDNGIINSLAGNNEVNLKTTNAGFLFETFILNELRLWIEYNRKDLKLSYWKSKSNFEVDFLLDSHTAIEVKCKEQINKADLKGLLAIGDEKPIKKQICVYNGLYSQEIEGIPIYPFAIFLNKLWNNEIC